LEEAFFKCFQKVKNILAFNKMIDESFVSIAETEKEITSEEALDHLFKLFGTPERAAFELDELQQIGLFHPNSTLKSKLISFTDLDIKHYYHMNSERLIQGEVQYCFNLMDPHSEGFVRIDEAIYLTA